MLFESIPLMNTPQMTIGILFDTSEYQDVRTKILFDLSLFYNVIVFTHEKNDISFFDAYPTITVVRMKFFGVAPFFRFAPSRFSPTNIKLFNLNSVREYVEKCDVVLTPEVFSSYSYFFLKQAKRIKPSILCVPMVYETIQHHITRYLPPYSWFQHVVTKQADAFWAFTDKSLSYLEKIGVEKNKNFRVYQGIIIPENTTAKTQKEPVLIKILFCGRLVSQKGIYETAQVFDTLSHTYSNIEFHICGDGPLRAEIESLNNKRIYIHGFIAPGKVAEFYKTADIFCLMSKDFYRLGVLHFWEEQLGNVLIEAMSYGLPIITSDNGAIPEVVGQDALICTTETELQTAMEKLILDPTLRSKMGQANILRAKNLFDIEKNTRLLAEELFQRYSKADERH